VVFQCLQIIVRKVYHLLAGGLFVPVFFWDLPMLCLSLAIAFAVLQLLEVVRHLQLPRIGVAVQQFMQVRTVQALLLALMGLWFCASLHACTMLAALPS
jgi:uncharacterized membrane protein YqaE (UPF0057 family)